MTLWTASDVHPPLFFWSLFAATRLAGETEFAARFPSLIYGVLTIPLAYQLGRKLANHSAGLLAALLLATARFHVWWSQELRMYILAGLCGTASLYFLMAWWKKEKEGAPSAWRVLLPYTLASVAALYTLYLSVFVLVVENAFVFIVSLGDTKARQRRLWRQWAVAQLATVALFAPWLALALPRMHTWSTATPFDFTSFLRVYAIAYPLGISTHVERFSWIALPFWAICLAGLALALHQARQWRAELPTWPSCFLLGVCLTLPPLAVYLLSMPRNLFYSPRLEVRYFLPFAPPFYILLAWGIWLLWQRWRLIGILSVLFVCGAFAWTLPQHYRGRYLRDELQSMARVITSCAEEGDAVCLVSGDRYPVFDYYYHDPTRPRLRPTVYYLPRGDDFLTVENVHEQLEPIISSHPRIWLALVDSSLQDPEGMAKATLASRYQELLSYRFAHNSLYLYAKETRLLRISAENLKPDHALSWDAGLAGTAIGYDLPTKEYRSGDTIHLALYLKTLDEATVSVEMQDERGRVLESRDARLPASGGAIVRQSFDFPIYHRTPAGRYHFYVQMADDSGSSQPGLEFGQVLVKGTLPLPRIGQFREVPPANLGDLASLEGYDLQVRGRRGEVSSLRPGDALELTLYWRSLQKIKERYTVFTHLVGEAYNPATKGPVWGQHDSEPLEGGLPTTQWFVGQIVPDRHLLMLDPQAPPGEYELEVGLYDLATNTRLQVRDRDGQVIGDRVLLGKWPVQAAP